MEVVRIGTVSEGTLEPAGLLVAFGGELRRLCNYWSMGSCWGDDDHRNLGRSALALVGACAHLENGDFGVDGRLQDALAHTRDDMVEMLTNALKEYAPPYSFFGPRYSMGRYATPWEDSNSLLENFGFWPDVDALIEAIQDKFYDSWEVSWKETSAWDKPDDYVLGGLSHGTRAHIDGDGGITLYSIATGDVLWEWRQ